MGMRIIVIRGGIFVGVGRMGVKFLGFGGGVGKGTSDCWRW